MPWPDFSRRSNADELMDDLDIGGHELQQALDQLRWINRLLGGSYPTCEGVQRLWQAAGRPEYLHILDIGAGSGEHGKHLLRWADRQQVKLTMTLLDLHPESCAAASAYYADEPRVQIQQGDLFALSSDVADIVTASLVLHHIPDQQLGTALLILRKAARLGVVINDLHRHAFAWASIWLLTQLLSQNRMIRHDAALSVLRGFQKADFQRMASLPGMESMWYRWRPMFRYLVLVWSR